MFAKKTISEQEAQNVVELYKEVNKMIRTKKSKSMYYEQRQGMEKVFKALGVDVEKLREENKVEKKKRDSSKVVELEKLVVELKAKLNRS